MRSISGSVNRNCRQRGMTLVEVMVALAIFGVVVAAAGAFFLTQSSAFERIFSAHAALADEEAFVIIGRDVRTAVAALPWNDPMTGDSYFFLVEPRLDTRLDSPGNSRGHRGWKDYPIGLAFVGYRYTAATGQLERWSWDDFFELGDGGSHAASPKVVTVARKLAGFTAEEADEEGVGSEGVGSGMLRISLTVGRAPRQKTYSIDYTIRNDGYLFRQLPPGQAKKWDDAIEELLATWDELFPPDEWPQE